MAPKDAEPTVPSPSTEEPLSLKGCKILLALTGSIAAYKAVFLLRLLTKAGAEVQVLMSEGACSFIQPLTLSALSARPVLRHFHNTEDGRWHDHVSLALWADLLVIAPLSAHTLSKMAQGHCDNLLIAAYMSARCPVLLAPAMDRDMYVHPSTKAHLETMRRWGHHLLEAEVGPLASGLHGQGRMAAPETIFSTIESLLNKSHRFTNIRVLITAGPTQENIDPVRFISNRSSGKMGVAIAEAFVNQGAEVDLILGPSALDPQHPRLYLHRVQQAEDMYQMAQKLHTHCQIAVFAAAVSDYRPQYPQAQKIKKEKEQILRLSLTKNPDIAQRLGAQKKGHQFHVGFALETQEEAKNARKKQKNKHFDMVVLNSLQEPGAGFDKDTNKVSFFYKNGTESFFPLKTKHAVAQDILEAIYTQYLKKKYK